MMVNADHIISWVFLKYLLYVVFIFIVIVGLIIPINGD